MGNWFWRKDKSIPYFYWFSFFSCLRSEEEEQLEEGETLIAARNSPGVQYRAAPPRYRHFDDPGEVVLHRNSGGGGSKYLDQQNYGGGGGYYEDEGYDDRWRGADEASNHVRKEIVFSQFSSKYYFFIMLPPFQISYDYMIGDGRGDEDDDGGVDVITPFSTSTFRPVTYDYNIGRDEEEEEDDRLSFVTESPTSRRPPPVYFGPDIPSSPSLLPTLRPATLLKNRQ